MHFNRHIKYHHSKNTLPLMIRYFMPTEGVKTKILEFDELTGETALQITEYILNIFTEKQNIEKEVILLSANNANINFGGIVGQEKNYVFFLN